MTRRFLAPLTAGALAAAFAPGAHPIVSAQQGGTITGHVKLTGTPPRNALIQMAADPSCLQMNAGKSVSHETVVASSDGRLANVFVNVQGTFPNSPAPSTSVILDQRGCTYRPRIQGARVGQTLEVKNSDQTLHNIHSQSTKNNTFNMGQPMAGMVSKIPLKSEEVMLRVKCDVHSWMTGYVGIVHHPYFAVTDTAGGFTIANVPPGKQTLQVWHELYGPLTQTVDVKPGASATIDFIYTGNEKPPAAAFNLQDLTLPAGVTTVQLLPPSSSRRRFVDSRNGLGMIRMK